MQKKSFLLVLFFLFFLPSIFAVLTESPQLIYPHGCAVSSPATSDAERQQCLGYFACEPILIKWIPAKYSEISDTDAEKQVFYKLEYTNVLNPQENDWKPITDGYLSTSEFKKSIGAKAELVVNGDGFEKQLSFQDPNSMTLAFESYYKKGGSGPQNAIGQINYVTPFGTLPKLNDNIQTWFSEAKGQYFPSFSQYDPNNPSPSKLLYVSLKQGDEGIFERTISSPNSIKLYGTDIKSGNYIYVYVPRYSPNGAKIVFVKSEKSRDSPGYSCTTSSGAEKLSKNFDIYVMNSDGSNAKAWAAVSGVYESYPSFLDNETILYFSNDNGTPSNTADDTSYEEIFTAKLKPNNTRDESTIQKLSINFPQKQTRKLSPVCEITDAAKSSCNNPDKCMIEHLPQNSGVGNINEAGWTATPGGGSFYAPYVFTDQKDGKLKVLFTQKGYPSTRNQTDTGNVGELFIMNIDGSGLEQLTYNYPNLDPQTEEKVGGLGYNVFWPLFSPVSSMLGQKIFFSADKDIPAGGYLEDCTNQSAACYQWNGRWSIWSLDGQVLTYLWNTQLSQYKYGVPPGTNYKVRVSISTSSNPSSPDKTTQSEQAFTIKCSDWPPYAEAGGPYYGMIGGIPIKGIGKDDVGVSSLVWDTSGSGCGIDIPSLIETGIGTPNASSEAILVCPNAADRLIKLTAKEAGGLGRTAVDFASVHVLDSSAIKEIDFKIISMKAEPFIIQTGGTTTINVVVRNFSNRISFPVKVVLSSDDADLGPIINNQPQFEKILPVFANESTVFSFPLNSPEFTSLFPRTYSVKAVATVSFTPSKTSFATTTFSIVEKKEGAIPETSLLFVPLVLAAVLFVVFFSRNN